MKKLIELDEKLVKQIQEVANKTNDGNFTKTVIDLIKKGLTK